MANSTRNRIPYHVGREPPCSNVAVPEIDSILAPSRWLGPPHIFNFQTSSSSVWLFGSHRIYDPMRSRDHLKSVLIIHFPVDFPKNVSVAMLYGPLGFEVVFLRQHSREELIFSIEISPNIR